VDSFPICGSSLVGQRSPLHVYNYKLNVLLGEIHNLTFSLPDISNILPVSHAYTSQHAVWCSPGWNFLPFSIKIVCIGGVSLFRPLKCMN
jgi:hypothetical protein